ncbi:MAG: immunoglobulin domain-containing protein, partial [Clostridia bacterium]|nr:immunoglobulin domain-containing protein [Clostridia bacterium]
MKRTHRTISLILSVAMLLGVLGLPAEAGGFVPAGSGTSASSEPLTVVTQPESQTVNPGATVWLTVTAQGGKTPYTYQWYRSSSATAAGSRVSTNQNYTFTTVSRYSGYTYYCVITDAKGDSVTSGRAKITIGTNAESEALSVKTQPQSQTVSAGASVQLTVTAQGGKTPYTYQWYRSSSATAAGSRVSTSQTYTFTAIARYSGYTYYCVITDAKGDSVTSDQAKLTVGMNAEPEALSVKTQPQSQTVSTGASVQLTVTAQGGKTPY